MILLDRSASIGYNIFEEKGKDFVETFLRSAVIVHPDYTRLAIITFAATYTVVIDGITGVPLTGCALFSKKGRIKQILYYICILCSK